MASPSLHRALALSVLAAALSHCGGPSEGAKVPPAPTATPSPADDAGKPGPASTTTSPPTAATGKAPEAAVMEKPFRQMTMGEKKNHMKMVVTPRMAAVFQAWNAKGFEDFGCLTCHGPSAKTGNFAMPSSALPRLDPTDGFKKELEKHPAVMKFMSEKVVPEMAAALGVAPYDPATQKGFGCGGCHKLEH